MCENNELQHFILTRFNLLLWNKDKGGRKVRTRQWLTHRFALFEQYCLPSVLNQTCQDFVWIVLFDSTTPEEYLSKIKDFQKHCPQFTPVFVTPENGRFFAQIFRDEVVKRMNARRVLTTYLDNDDALCIHFVEDVQQRTSQVADGTFIRYRSGYQFYTDHQYLMQVVYPKNHFVSVVEKGDRTTLKGIFGYGGHYHIDEIPGVKILNVENVPLWCEVVHEKNMINDAYFLVGSKMVREKDFFSQNFAVDDTLNIGRGIYLFRFIPRYMKTFMRRTKNYLFGKQW